MFSHRLDSNIPEPSLGIATMTSTAHSVPQLTRELWDTRRQIAAAAARETYISECIRQLNGSSKPNTHNGASRFSFFLSLQNNARCRYLSFACDEDARSLLMKAEKALVSERRRRKEAELILEDVRRECREPSVVPRLLEALERLPASVAN